MISQRLTMRAAVERNTAAGKDAWGGPVEPNFTALHAALPCFVWSRNARELADGAKTAIIEDLRIMVALGVDLVEGDEITAVSNASGTVIIPGRLKIEGAVVFKHNHLEASLQRIG